jgi:SAM-dependent methyltransferase
MLVRYIDDAFYPGIDNFWDDRILKERVLNTLKPTDTLLDYGAGAGILDHFSFKESCDKVIGIDYDPRVLDNPFLDDAYVMKSNKLPFDDQSIDVVVLNNVCEHLEKPDEVFSELSRVLVKGGKVLFKTPNRWHYVALFASLTPLSFHKYYMKKLGRKEDDTFPTFYRFNDSKKVWRVTTRQGFTAIKLDFIEGRPEYLRTSSLFYIFGVLFERTVNCFEFLRKFRCIIVGQLEKKL